MGFQPAFLPKTHNFPTVSGALAPADPAGWYKAMPASALFEPLRRFSGTGQSRLPDQSRCPLSPGPLPAAWRPARSAPHPSALPSRPAGRLIRIPALFHTISAADPKQQHRRPALHTSAGIFPMRLRWPAPFLPWRGRLPNYPFLQAAASAPPAPDKHFANRPAPCRSARQSPPPLPAHCRYSVPAEHPYW